MALLRVAASACRIVRTHWAFAPRRVLVAVARPYSNSNSTTMLFSKASRPPSLLMPSNLGNSLTLTRDLQFGATCRTRLLHIPYIIITSPPPPRFFSPPPASSSFNNPLGDSAPAFQRVNNGYGFPPASVQPSMSTFSPFSISSPPQKHSNIPEQTSSELQDHHFPNRAISPPANIA